MSGLFHERRRLSGRERRLIVRAVERGVRTTRIASRLSISPASVHRIWTEWRLLRLRRLRLAAPADIDDARTASALEPEVVCAGLAAWPEPIPIHAGELAELADGQPPIAASAERALLVARAALLDRAGWLIAGTPVSTPPVGPLDRAETDLRWAAMLGWTLLRGQTGVVIRAVRERVGREGVALGPDEAAAVTRVAMEAAWSAISPREAASRSGRLAAPVGVALARTLAPVLALIVDAGRSAAATRRPVWLEPDAVWPRADLKAAISELNAADQRVLRARYGLEGLAAMTVDEAAAVCGVSRRGAAECERRLRRARPARHAAHG